MKFPVRTAPAAKIKNKEIITKNLFMLSLGFLSFSETLWTQLQRIVIITNEAAGDDINIVCRPASTNYYRTLLFT